MAPNILNEPSFKAWLEKRRKAFNNLRDAEFNRETRRWLEERKALPSYTSSRPHSCEHCDAIVLDLEGNKQGVKVQLPYGLTESVLAARGGCALYQIFVDSVFARTTENTRAAWSDTVDLRFFVHYFREELPDQSAQLHFTITAPSHDGTDHALMPNPAEPYWTVWTLEGDPAAFDVSTRPYELDYQSSTSTAWARQCIEYCQMNHRECIAPEDNDGNMEVINPESVPSRLLKLSLDKDGLLHAQIIGRDTGHQIPTLEVSRRGFAVLSYCWGGSQPIQLTRESVKSAPTYPITVLPKTLSDAAWYTHHLGLEYLWIDALCILQDDPDDKGQEIPRMGQYYGDATVTICAASAHTCFRGFLTTPPAAEDPVDYLFGPLQLRVKTTRGELGTIQALREPEYFNSHWEREPIVQRGWTLQESLLSRRILIFSSHHLYFSCREANASCGGREPLPKSRFIGTYESRVPGINTISSLQRVYPAVSTWDKVVSEYTQRCLGVFADKLPAISAMAGSLVRMARDERAQELQYCAGLMLDREGKDWGWKGELLWAVTEPASPLVPSEHYTSPSWSWASLQAPINRWRAIADNLPSEDGIRLLDVDAPLENARNLFGSVKGGIIKLMARTRPLPTIDNATIHMVVTRNTILEDDVYDESSYSVLLFRPDTEEVEGIINRGGEGIFLMELIAARATGMDTSRPSYPAGLLIMRSNEGERYRRVGIFEFKFNDVQRARAMRDLALEQARTLFSDCQLNEVCIV
ncbi:HET-domain-containing protein [Xylaria palmicola]|nr:HET-domain-containing protein [Xylaria palmicola]